MRPAFEEDQLRSRHHGYVTGVDGMRTIAVLGVIIYHLLPNMMVGGFLGVPLFLLISGYFVTNQLLKKSDRGGIDLVHFYQRRFSRLYPILVTMLVFTTAYITLFDRMQLHHIKAVIVTNLLWVYNWWEIFNGQSYFDRFGGESPFTHLWTLGVEAQFYVLWPLILLLLLRFFSKRVVKWLILLLAILSAVEMALLFGPQNINRVYYGTDTRAFSLLLGSWLAFIWPREQLNERLNKSATRLLNTVGIVTLALTILSFFISNGQVPQTYHGAMFAYSFVGMLLLATIVHPGADMNRWLTNPFFKWVGERSYGIYVYQYPVMIFYEAKVQIGAHPIMNAVIELLLIVVISELSYRFIERPLKHYSWRDLPLTIINWFDVKRRGWKQWLAIIPALLVFFVAVAGFTTPDRAPKTTQVQTRIKQSRHATAARNKLIAEGKAPKIDVNSKSLQKKYGLSKKELKHASKLKVTAIGDSVMADASDSIQQVVPHAYVEAKVGRQGSDAPAVIKDLKANGHLNRIVILNLGTNGAMNSETVNQIIQSIGKGHQIYWITAHVPTKSWEKTVNNQIKQAAKKHSNIHVVDWNQQSASHSNWFADDNVHMNDNGNVQFTRLIVKSILK
ncbi:acyltransferase family protein [Limosilactobacillus caecicola]|uniref:acyltransferase family protein n=1 Tax=Limosilactobacillus caecicola TaxID=2941332 RepID=UPI00203F7203|nr:acyltransferase family protein [Limosilactobacillus caecicola]